MRRLTRKQLSSLLLCGLATAPAPLLAQQGRAKVQVEQPSATPEPPAAQEPRPEAEPLREEAVSPELEAVLQDWFNQTKGVRKLQGKHFRWKYDTTFAVAKISKGSFYYEGPDKGRIDIVPVPPNPKQPKTDDGAGNAYTVKPDQPERWVCDGKQILRIDDTEKTYESLPIPPQHQGANIMDGPLPFLFGMPPEKAKQRYKMELVSRDETAVFLTVRPRKREDLANWQRADVKLDAKTFLPMAVKLLDPAATGTTVFRFEETQVNPNKIIEFFKGDPFKPVLLTYKEVQSGDPSASQPLNLEGRPITGIPSVIGLNHAEATTVLGKRGYRKVEIRKGPVAQSPKQLYHVASQVPEPNAAVASDQTIVLTLYVAEKDLKKTEQPPQGQQR